VKEGEVVGLLGPNGAGKTTTMRILACIFPPTSGVAAVGSFDVLKEASKVKESVGYLPEYTPYYPDMRVVNYLHFVAQLKGIRSGERKRRVEEIMERCNLEEVERRYIKNLSRGYRQRVGLAQALVNDANVLILDEPTLGLDPKQRVHIRKLIRTLSEEGRTLLISTHMLSEASMICQRVVVMNHGRVVTADSPESLSQKLQKKLAITLKVGGPVEEIRKTLLSTPLVNDVTVQDTGEAEMAWYNVSGEGSESLAKSVSQTIIRRGWSLLEMKTETPSLEEVFMALVEEEVQSEEEA